MKLTRALRFGRRSMRDAVRAASMVLNAPWAEPTPLAAEAAAVPGVMEIASFGSNPGNLRMFVYAPAPAPRPGMPLLLVLHGCGQKATALARDAGWIRLADRLGLPLLLPAQQAENNRGNCFQWFRPADIRRGRGEAASIRQMTAAAVEGFRSDPKRVLIAGFSAGGAMAAALLAAYPDVFAGGAAVSAMPVGAAADIGEALARMSHASSHLDVQTWAERARGIGPSGFVGPWPRLSIWRGTEDHTVDPGNSEILAQQWAGLHRFSAASWTETEPTPGVRRRVWGLPEEPSVELWTIPRLGHAWPLGPEGEPDSARWVRQSPVAATDRIASFWCIDNT